MLKNKPVLPQRTEFKSFHFEHKSIDAEQGIITGYLSTYSNVDLQGDRVLKGAFAKTVTEGKQRMQKRGFIWPILWHHEVEKPIGKVIDAEEDEKGLLITAQLDISTNSQGIPNNTTATMAFSGFKSSFISELSMGYIAIQKEYNKGVRDLKECAILEASACTSLFAANPCAQVTGVKNMATESAPELDNSKGSDMNERHKDFNTLFQSTQAADCLEDWGALINTLTKAMLELFSLGDAPQQNMQQCLEQFNTAAIAWAEAGLQCGLPEYIRNNYGGNNTPYVPYSLRIGDDWGYMTRSDKPDGKAGRTISTATQGKLEQHQTDMKVSLEEMQEKCGSMLKMVGGLSSLWGEVEEEGQDANEKNNVQPSSVKSNADEITLEDLAALL